MQYLSKLHQVSDLPFNFFHAQVITAIGHHGHRLASLFVCQGPLTQLKMVAVLVNDNVGSITALSANPPESYECFTSVCPEAHLFEREIWEQWGIRPNNHPCLKPVRFYSQGSPYFFAKKITPIGDMEYFQIEGGEAHDVGVGPVHAGIIGPGHFRFSCHGEHVYHLEISLGYQHRGLEEKLIGGPDKKTIFYIEAAAGDTTMAHSWAYCANIESLANLEVSLGTQVLRAIMLELERMANHIGDIGDLAGDVGFMPTQAYCGRIRGDFLNLTAYICGNRFGRSMLLPGGMHFGLPYDRIGEFKKKLDAAFVDAKGAADLLWDNSGILSRFENVGIVTNKMVKDLGLVGVAARSSGATRDIRANFKSPFDLYQGFKIALGNTGDVFARAHVRWKEMEQSYHLIKNWLRIWEKDRLAPNPRRQRVMTLSDHSIAVSLVEGQRGEVCHTVITGENGKILYYKIVDPSFHNWIGLAMAMRGEEIYDFPLCNKSFNLSYCGYDL